MRKKISIMMILLFSSLLCFGCSKESKQTKDESTITSEQDASTVTDATSVEDPTTAEQVDTETVAVGYEQLGKKEEKYISGYKCSCGKRNNKHMLTLDAQVKCMIYISSVRFCVICNS